MLHATEKMTVTALMQTAKIVSKGQFPICNEHVYEAAHQVIEMP
jgi:hypothetical protein